MIDVQFTPEFKRNLRTLAKKYRHIRDDVDPVIKALQAGEILGDQIPGVGYTLFKVRVRIFSIFRGEGLQCQGGTAFS